MWIVGSVFACFPQIAGGGVTLRVVAILVAVSGYAGLLVLSVINSRKIRKLVTERRAETAQMMEQSLYPPALSKYKRPDSVITLEWTIDYKTCLRCFVSVFLYTPSVLVSAALVGFFFAILLSSICHLTNWGVIAAVFLAGAGLTYLLRYNRICRVTKPLFQTSTVNQSMALIMDPDGFRELIGSIEKVYPWDMVMRVWLAKGNAAIIRDSAVRIVPHFAFHSREDAVAFAAQANALKKGMPLPAHDWSSYSPQEPVNDGVWPPAPL